MTIVKKKLTCFLHGIALIEILIALSLGLLLIFSTIKLYLSVQASHQLNQTFIHLSHQASHAMAFMVWHLRQAGFGHVMLPMNTDQDEAMPKHFQTDLVDAAGHPVQGLRGCDAGFHRPEYTCVQAADVSSSSFEVAYRVAEAWDMVSGTGGDCLHASIHPHALLPGHPANGHIDGVKVAVNRFYVEKDTLFCHGNGGQLQRTRQPILDGVERLRLHYAVMRENGLSWLTARQVEDLSEDVKANWQRVHMVQLCLQVRSEHPVLNVPQPNFQGCDDNDGVLNATSDRVLRLALKRVVALRNHL